MYSGGRRDETVIWNESEWKSCRGCENIRNPKLLILASNPGQFEQHVKELEELYPQVPSIGCIAMSYGDKWWKTG